MALGFRRAFGHGVDDKSINSIDSSGGAFAAIQGLNFKLTDELKALRSRLAAKDEEATNSTPGRRRLRKNWGCNSCQISGSAVAQ